MAFAALTSAVGGGRTHLHAPSGVTRRCRRVVVQCEDEPAVRDGPVRFRPCIDLHEGRVKQVVGSTLRDNDANGALQENFASDKPPSYYASMYRRDNLPGGHVIMLGPGNEDAAIEALNAYPGGLQVGGGINPGNAKRYLDAGASHVIVTSYVFHDGEVDWDRLEEMRDAVGKAQLVLDLSCRRSGPFYFVCSDRWQKWTNVRVETTNMNKLAKYCDEFLVHAVDVEGRRCGVLKDLVMLLGAWSPIPVTYAGGVKELRDLDLVRAYSRGRVDVTIGSALDIFGGNIRYESAVQWQRQQEAELGAAL